MAVKRIEPDCNLATIRDGRGGIFTYYPKDPIVEMNFQFVNKGKIRGNHYHPEFDEYYVITDGHAMVVWRTPEGSEEYVYLAKGECVFIGKNTPHVTYAITDFNMMTFLTKKWNDCAVPIVHENLGMGAGDHGDPNYQGPK